VFKPIPVKWIFAAALAACAPVCVATGEMSTNPAIPFPEGFEKLAVLALRESGTLRCTIDCQKFYEASELWRKETDPIKKAHAKVQLQGLLFQFYNPPGERTFENLASVEESKLYARMLEVLAGGELDSSELNKGAKIERNLIKVHAADWLDINLEEEPTNFRRHNAGDVDFEFRRGEEVLSKSISLDITPVSADQFQVFAGPSVSPAPDENILDPDSGLRGFLFRGDGSVLAHFDENRAAAACFDPEGNALLIVSRTNDAAENSPPPLLWSFEVISPTGEKIWSEETDFTSDDFGCAFSFWAVWPSPDNASWTIQAVDGGTRGWFESSFETWRVRRSPRYASEKLSEESIGDEEKPTPILGHDDPAFRFARSTPYSSFDGRGKAGFRFGFSRYCSSPIYMEGYASLVDPELNRIFESDRIYTAGKDALFLPQTSGASLRGAWPATDEFFISSDNFWPVFGDFIRQRRGNSVKQMTSSENEFEALGEPATFFYDEKGNFRAWVMGTVVGDAADGECLLIANSLGELLTIAPNCEVREVREFETSEGAKAKPVLLSDINCAGTFLVGNALVVATWQAD